MTICDGDDIGRHEGRNVTGLGLDDRKCRQRSRPTFHYPLCLFFYIFRVDTGCTLEQSGVQVEDVTRISLTTRRTAQQQGDLPVSPGLFGQVVIDDQCIFTAIPEVLAHGAACIGGDVLHGRRVGSTCGYNDGVIHRTKLFQFAHQCRNGGVFLTDRDIDTLNASTFLINDGIKCDGGLPGLTVTDDQLALTTTNRNHGVDGLETSLYRLVDGLTRDNARGHFLDRGCADRIDRALPVNGITQRVDNSAKQTRTHWDLKHATGATHPVTFGQMRIIAKDHRTHRVTLQVQGKTEGIAWELEHFIIFGI